MDTGIGESKDGDESWAPPSTLAACVEQFLRLQDDRIDVFKTFNSSLQQHLKTSDTVTYTHFVSTCTASFRSIGLRMKSISDLHAPREGDSFGGSADETARLLFRQVQMVEKRHLELEVRRHRLEVAASKEESRLALLEELPNGSNVEGAGRCHAAFVESFEPNEAFPQAKLMLVSEELSGVLREISDVVEEINGLVSELRMAKNDVQQ